MITLYRFFAVAILTCLASTAFSQISGTLKDEKGQSVSYANVALLHATDSSLLTGAVSDAEGRFQLKSPEQGNYLLRLSAIGFAPLYTPSFTSEGNSFTKDFGVIVLREDVQLLQEVSVESMRPTIIAEADKMVVSVEGTAMAAGSTAFDVLERSPGVWIDQDGNIQLNGQAGVRVMIDGRLTYLSAKELQNALEGMSAENIKNIELINNPSAKYDAEGTSGIININLKKNTLGGLNGSVHGGYQYNGLTGYSGGANINYKQGKWSSFANIDVAQRARFRDARFFREFNTAESSTTFDQEAREVVKNFTPSLRLGTEFDISSDHSLGAMVNFTNNKGSHDFRTDSYLRNGNAAEDLFIDANNMIESKFKNLTMNLHYMGKIDTLGSTLSADLDFVRIEDQANASFLNRFDSLAQGATDYQTRLTSENPSGYNIYSAKLDYTRVLPYNRKIEMGAKSSRVVSDNLLNFYIHQDATKVPDASRSNHFVYEENIYAGYLNFSTPLGKKINVQAGIRAEQTVAEGRSITANKVTPREYLNLFPSLFVQQNVTDNYQLNYNYSRRINRPHYEMLNPFIFFLDPYTYAQGNPYLRPQYSHSFGITQTFKQSYNLVLEYAKTTDFISEVPLLNDETKITIFDRRNVDDAHNASATVMAPVKIMRKWNSNNNATFAYQRYTTVLDEELLLNDAFFYMAQSNHTIMLPADFRFEVNAAYQGPLASGLYKIKGQWWVDSGVKKSFMNDKLDVSMNVTDIFKTRWVRGTANVGDDINGFNQYFSARGFRLSLRYRFSKGEEFEMKKRNTTLEELNRAGG